jgi:hypothetical protein
MPEFFVVDGNVPQYVVEYNLIPYQHVARACGAGVMVR